jgi:hypothetical protein
MRTTLLSCQSNTCRSQNIDQFTICQRATNGQTCNDGNACTSPDTCQWGGCSGPDQCRKPCPLPWGGMAAHGTNVTAWRTPSERHPNRCQSRTAMCNNGSLDLGGYQYRTCDQQCVNYAGIRCSANLGSITVPAQWAFHNGWCVTPLCSTYYAPGSSPTYYNVGSSLAGYRNCRPGSSGTCYDGDAWWDVTCSPYMVDGEYSCEGACRTKTYPPGCPGHP